MRRMEPVVIITNNPYVRDAYETLALYTDCDVRSIFIAVRDRVHGGARVLSHPLSGSIKPWESPYKSVVISAKRGALDFASLQLIEGALEKMNAYASPHMQKKPPHGASLLADFRIIDLDLMRSAIQSYGGIEHGI